VRSLIQRQSVSSVFFDVLMCFCLSVLVLVLLEYRGGASCENSSYGKEPEPENDLLMELLALAMSRGGEVMQAEVVWFCGIHVFLFWFVRGPCSSRIDAPQRMRQSAG
jgi:hypothetical protein